VLGGLERGIRRLTRAIALGAVACLLGLALLTVADVLLRWLFAAPIRGFVDVVSLAMAVIAAACFPALIANRGNVTIRLAEHAGGPGMRRALESFGAAVTLVLFALMAWQYVLYAAEMTSSGERLGILKWPVGPWWWAVAALIAFTALVALAVLAREIAGAPRDDTPAR